MICPKCGATITDGATFCNSCGGMVKPETDVPVIKKGSSRFPTVAVLSVAAVLIVAVALFAAIKLSPPEKDKTADMEISEEVVEEVVGAEDSSYEPVVNSDGGSAESAVSVIRERYYDAQNNLDSYRKETYQGGVTKYFDENNSLVRVDDVEDNGGYSKCYYYSDGKLYFVFACIGKIENRFYFKDDVLIRWIDEAGNTHDNDRNDDSYLFWEENLLEEAEFLK